MKTIVRCVGIAICVPLTFAMVPFVIVARASYESADNIADIFFDWIRGRSAK